MEQSAKRSTDSLQANVVSLRSYLEDSSDSNSFAELWSESTSRPASFHEITTQVLHLPTRDWRDLERTLSDIQICCDAPMAPILAVMGLLNAGKSSLVASFLSQPGRERILIGSGNHQGTHRFVLWLPTTWRNSEIVWRFIETRLEAIFPHGFELLANSPEAAGKQYNDAAMLHIPLVAFDDGLDQLQVALMDCPDVQTGLMLLDQSSKNRSSISTSETSPVSSINPLGRDPLAEQVNAIASKRLEVLSQAAPICSAYLIVLPANALHEQKVGELMQVLRKRMPHSQQMLAVNRVPRKYSTLEIQREIEKLYPDKLLHRTYMAYGFDGPQRPERIPVHPPFFVPPTEPTKLPLFFRVDQSPPPQPPQTLVASDWLLTIGKELDGASLLLETLRSQVATLRNELRSLAMRLRTRESEDARVRRTMLQLLAESCLEFSREPGGSSKIRLQASQQIIEQISQSLENTAPWWARPGRWTTRLIEYGKNQVGQIGNWVKLPTWMADKSEGLLKYIRGRWGENDGARVVTADALLRSLERNDLNGIWGFDALNRKNTTSMLQGDVNPLETSRGDWLEVIQSGINRFHRDSRIELDTRELDQVTKRMWEQMPMGRRLATGFAPAAILFAPLLAVIMIPMDFGGSSVLVFASLKELLGAGVAGLGMAMLSPDRMPKLAEAEAAWQQLGDLIAVLCDAIGLDRPTPENQLQLNFNGEMRDVPQSNIANSRSTDTLQDPATLDSRPNRFGLVPAAWRIRAGSLDRLETQLNSLSN